MKILITGSSGFIGSNIILGLNELFERVYGVDNFNNFTYPSSYKRFRSGILKKIKKFNEIEIDLKDIQKISNILIDNKIDTLLHLAAYPGVRQSINYPYAYIVII